MSTQNFDATNGSGRLQVVDATTGEQLFVLDTDAPAASMSFDPTSLELIAGLADGSVITVALLTGDIISSVATTATTPVGALGLRSDGLIVAVSNGQIELVDRRTGSPGVVTQLRRCRRRPRAP